MQTFINALLSASRCFDSLDAAQEWAGYMLSYEIGMFAYWIAINPFRRFMWMAWAAMQQRASAAMLLGYFAVRHYLGRIIRIVSDNWLWFCGLYSGLD